jgi:hypothetical protein
MFDHWNPGKPATVVILLVLATALVTGIVVANWTGGGERRAAVEPPKAEPHPPRVVGQAPAAPARSATPTQDVVDACNHYASVQAGARDKTKDTLTDVAVGAALGAAVGAAGGAIAGGGKGAGKGAGIGGVVGAGAGTLYGLNENKKHDERYRDAYAGCLRSRGYAG